VHFSLLFVLTVAFALASESEPAGRSMGQKFIDAYGGQRKGHKVKEKLLNPASQGGRYVVPTKDGEKALEGPPSVCMQVESERELARGVLRKNDRLEYEAEFYYGGKVLRWKGKSICPEGACSEDGCVKVSRQGDSLVLERVQSLNGCIPASAVEPPAGYAFGQAIKLYQEMKGYSVTRSEETSGEVRYYGGYLACRGQARANASIPQTSYYHNPYRIGDDAIYRQIYCQQRPEDSECRASLSVSKAMQSYAGSEQERRTCELRRVINPQLYSEKVCVPGYRVYPDGYSDARPYCMGDFFEFSAGLWLECNTDGTGYRLRGFGFREGYYDLRGRYSTDVPPSEPYPLDVPVVLDRTYGWTYAGTLKTGNGDYTVEYSNSFDGMRNVFSVRINSTTCNSLVWTLDRPSAEFYAGCEEEERNCTLSDVWWIDAHGREWQVIRGGVPVSAVSGCDEVVRDESLKRWVSFSQSLQSPAGNCSYPPKTCQTVEGRTECRRWFRQRRVYVCGGQAKHKPDLKRLEDVFFSTRIEDDGSFSYGRSCGYVCPEGQKEGNVCVRQKNTECEEGYFRYGNLCIREPECPAGTVWNRANLRCEGVPFCSNGYTLLRPDLCVGANWVDKENRVINVYYCQNFEQLDDLNAVCWRQKGPGRANYRITQADFGLSGFTGTVRFWAQAQDDPYIYYETPKGRVVLVQLKDRGWYDRSESGTFSTNGWFVVHAEDQGIIYGMQAVKVGLEIQRESAPSQCPAGSVFDGGSGMCVVDGGCKGGALNRLTGMCERELNPPCPEGWVKRGNACVVPAKQVCTEGGSAKLPVRTVDCQAQCVVKVRHGEYDLRECQGGVCPLSMGETLIEGCTCDPKSGFAISAVAMAWISQMVKDKQCER